MNSINLARERGLYTTFSQRAIQLHQQELARLQEQMSTQKRVNRASDDPASFSQARRMEALGVRYNQYQTTIDSSRAWVNQSQAALQELTEIFSKAYELGLRAANASFNQDDAETVARSLEDLLDQTIDGLNAQSGDEYLFAGSLSTVQPFTVDSGTGAVEYTGNTGARKRHIGLNISLTINLPGNQIHDTGNGYTITESLQYLIDGVRSGDHAAVTSALDQVLKSRNHLIDRTSEIGTIAGRLTVAQNQIADALLSVESRRSAAEDADFTETLMAFQKEQNSLQAALQTTASLLRTTILDYLR